MSPRLAHSGHKSWVSSHSLALRLSWKRTGTEHLWSAGERIVTFRDERRNRPGPKEPTGLWGLLESWPNKHLWAWFRMRDTGVGLGQWSPAYLVEWEVPEDGPWQGLPLLRRRLLLQFLTEQWLLTVVDTQCWLWPLNIVMPLASMHNYDQYDF